MPIYEYRCTACGLEFEELVRNPAEEAEIVCPACGAGGAERRLSACAVRVSGGAGSGAGEPAPLAAAGGCGGGGGFG